MKPYALNRMQITSVYVHCQENIRQRMSKLMGRHTGLSKKLVGAKMGVELIAIPCVNNVKSNTSIERS